ncbi:MAG: hypothetical protein JXL82_01035 [Candidatus Omnitrophica bacterium]|nr:hypothetical protein [Candidatus Omnitrophota bacterium]
MDKRKVKRVIAKEALIILGLSCVLYILIRFFLQNVPIVLPKYRLDFANGETHSLNIMPEIRTYSSYSKFLEEAYNPPTKLLEKRIKEFTRVMNIKSALRNKKFINPHGVYISRLYSRLLNTPFILKLIFIYLFLLSIRFIIWAVKVLTKPSLQH